MSIQLAAFAFGCFLLMVTILGGGFEVKELKVPKVGRASRLAACLFGALFICGGIKPALVSSMLDRGIGVEAKTVPATPKTEPAASAATSTVTAVQVSPSSKATYEAPRPAKVSTAKKGDQETVTSSGSSDESPKPSWRERAKAKLKKAKQTIW